MQSSKLRGILSMIAAVAAFAVMDVTMKRLVETYPPMQVTFLRATASLPFLLLATALFSRWRDLIPRRLGLHVLRGMLGVGTLWLFVYAVRFLSLADAYTIYMSAPLLITALSVPMLGEHVGWRRWLAIVIGLIGVIVVLKPSGTGLITIGGAAALASAVGYTLSAITIKILSRTDSGTATIFWALLFVALFSGIFTAFDWTPLQWQHWYLIAGVGLFGAIGQHCITYAFRLASPAIVAPIEYTALMWGMLFDWLLWLTLPNARMLVGASIIVASGLYIIYRERAQEAKIPPGGETEIGSGSPRRARGNTR
ncbi:DMT family transporter [Povalibacter sp.]|uniref:DMT family transporter n=1 Tax=Povalibacter sp. TaxID=1962978 RepID=UPI002F4245D8